MKCPKCGYDDSESMIKIHLELSHGKSSVESITLVKDIRRREILGIPQVEEEP